MLTAFRSRQVTATTEAKDPRAMAVSMGTANPGRGRDKLDKPGKKK
jgi:hypothetical protein